MAIAAKIPILITAVLAIHTAQAADPATSTAPPALNGAQLFATHCAMCHKPGELARRLQSAADPRAAGADAATFLARHGRSDADADVAIIDYLANARRPSRLHQKRCRGPAPRSMQDQNAIELGRAWIGSPVSIR